MRILVSGGTATVRRLSAKYPSQLGHLLTPANGNSVETLKETRLPLAVDNGAFSGFDPLAFRRLLQALSGHPMLWVAVPDKVGDARQTLWEFGEWREELQGWPLALVGQDGLEDLSIPWRHFCCFFIGGSTRWKLSRAAHDLAQEARRQGKQVHMGRVNSFRRLRTAHAWGCDSIDGGQFSRYGDTHLERYLRRVRCLDTESAMPMLFSGAARTTSASAGVN